MGEAAGSYGELSSANLLPSGGLGVRFLHGVWCGRVVPWLGDLVSGSRGTYRYLPQTIAAWPSPDMLAEDERLKL